MKHAQDHFSSIAPQYAVGRIGHRRQLIQFEAADIVQDAFMLLLLGEQQSGEGLPTDPQHLADHCTFISHVQDVIDSRVSELVGVLSE